MSEGRNTGSSVLALGEFHSAISNDKNNDELDQIKL